MIATVIGALSNPVDRLVMFVKERQRIYEVRQAGKPKPWTSDPVLQTVRFSNMLRENDTVTKWIAQTWRDPFHDWPDLWFVMVVARLVNEPATLAEMGFPLVSGSKHWNREAFEQTIVCRRAAGLRAYNPAYMLTTCNKTISKVQHHVQMLDSLWAARETLRPRRPETLLNYHRVLSEWYGLGSFLTGQVIADLKYAKDTPLEQAKDWMTFAASGPGSRRGMLRLEERPLKEWRADSEDLWWHKLIRLRDKIMPRLKYTKLYEAHAQDVQNWLCEFDKYERVRLGQGPAKQKYNGRPDK